MTREDIDRIATEYLNDTESTFEMQEVIELADKALILEEKINEYEQLLRSKDLSIQCFQASADMFREQNEKYEKAIEDIKADNLCNSCTNIACEFQYGIEKSSCAFYMPPNAEPDNCGNYISIIDKHIGGKE